MTLDTLEARIIDEDVKLIKMEDECVSLHRSWSRNLSISTSKQLPAVIALHYQLIQQYQKVLYLHGTSPRPGRLRIPSRLWKHAIHELDIYLQAYPDYRKSFLRQCYGAVLWCLAIAPLHRTFWWEKLGRLCHMTSGLQTVEATRNNWSEQAETWYKNALLARPWVGRIHHLRAEARGNRLQQMCDLAKALTCHRRFNDAEGTLVDVCSSLAQEWTDNHDAMSMEHRLAACLAIMWTCPEDSGQGYDDAQEILLNCPSTLRDVGPYLAVASIAACLQFGSTQNSLFHFFCTSQIRAPRQDQEEGLTVLSTFHAEQFVVDTLRTALEIDMSHIDDALPFLHVTLAWFTALEAPTAEHGTGAVTLEILEPLVKLFNKLQSRHPLSNEYAKRIEDIPVPLTLPWLPEDDLISGLAWDEAFFNKIRPVKGWPCRDVTRAHRVICIGLWLARCSEAMSYDPNNGLFSIVEKETPACEDEIESGDSREEYILV